MWKIFLQKLYYLRGRYYNPDIKSFTTPDPAEADARLYAYAGYDPLNFIDPSGYVVTKKKDKYGRTITTISEGDLKKIPEIARKVLSSRAHWLVWASDITAAVASFAGPNAAIVSLIYTILREIGLLDHSKRVKLFWNDLSDLSMEAYRLDEVVRIITNDDNDEVLIERYDVDGQFVSDDRIYEC